MSFSLRSTIGNTAILFFLMIAFMSPFVSEIGPIQFVVGLLTLAVLSLVVLLFFAKGIRVNDLPFIVFSAFLFLSALYGVYKGNALYDVARSIIPFLYLPLFYFVCSRLDKKQIQYIGFVLLSTGVVTSLFVFPFIWGAISSGTFSGARFTAYIDNAHLPILLLSIPILFATRLSKVPRYVFLLLILLAIFATKSKGQILFSVIIVYLCLYLSPSTGYLKNITAVKHIKLILIMMFVFSISFYIFKDAIVARMGGEAISGSTTSHRIEEFVAAWNAFSLSPFFGQGPGTTFDIIGANLPGNTEQRYVHNVVAYFMATGGIVGLLIYISLYFSFFSTISRKTKGTDSVYILLSILSIVLYSLVSASFKSIQTNAYLGYFLGSLYVYSKEVPGIFRYVKYRD